jgi:dihydroorotase
MRNYLIRNVYIVNEGRITPGDLLIKNGRIEKIGTNFRAAFAVIEINGDGKYLLPGVIDDQVHFREPGLTHKASIYSEARAAVAGGVTSFMEMPNTIPPAFYPGLAGRQICHWLAELAGQLFVLYGHVERQCGRSVADQ